MCSASTPTTTTARGRIARLICDRRIQGTTPHDQRSARSSATTGSAASSTSTTELPHETDTNIGALQGSEPERRASRKLDDRVASSYLDGRWLSRQRW